MGRDVTLYPKKATRDELKKYLEDLGFEKCGHFGIGPKEPLIIHGLTMKILNL